MRGVERRARIAVVVGEEAVVVRCVVPGIERPVPRTSGLGIP
jgi:hypothetical protein